MDLEQQIKAAMLEQINAAYVIDETDYTIQWASKLLQKQFSAPLVGQKCYQVFMKREVPCSFCPELSQLSESFYNWEYFDNHQKRGFQIRNMLLTDGEKHYRLGRIVDIEDSIRLNVAAMDYLALLKHISEMQVQILGKKQSIFHSSLPLIAKQFGARTALFAFTEGEKDWIFEFCKEKPEVIQYQVPNVVRTVKKLLGEERNCYTFSKNINVLRDLWSPHTAPFLETSSVLCAHLLDIEGQSLALLLEGNWKEPAFDDQLITIRVLEVYIENYLLQQKIQWENVHDKMTSLYNRREYFVRMEEHYVKAKTKGILYLDIDNLKKANDTKGHQQGDKMICKVGKALLHCTKERGDAFRMGGDEFAVILTNCDLSELECLSKGVQREITRLNEAEPDSLVEVSMGFAFSDGEIEWTELCRQADLKMYEAKRAKKVGRNYHMEDDN